MFPACILDAPVKGCAKLLTHLYATLHPTPPGIRVTRFCGPLVMLKGKMAMKASELHDKTPDQLRDELVNLKKESFNLRFQQATGQLENPARLRSVKRDVARVHTVLNQKAAAAASEGA